MLAGLPPEGQAAYRLFYDAEAKKLLDEAEGPAELKNLERIYSAYFPTSVGDNAADRLGDLYFELGRFDRAADCWLAVLRERPDTDLSPALSRVKAALALARAGRRAEFDAVRGELADRYADENVTLGGRTAQAGRAPPPLLGDESRRRPATAGRPPAPTARRPTSPATVDAAWQVRFADSVEAGMTPAELTQWESNPLSAAVPAVAIDGSTLFANYLGYVFALDLDERQAALAVGVVPQPRGPRDAGPGPDDRPEPVRDRRVGDYVWSLGRDLKDQNMHGPVPPDLPAGRGRRGRLAVDRPARLRRARPGRPADPGRRQALRRRQDRRSTSSSRAPAAAVRPGDPAPRRQDALEDRGRDVPRRASAYFYYGMGDTSPQPRLVLPGGVGLRRHPRRGPRPARRRVRASSTGATATRPSPSSRRTGSSSTTMQPQEPTAASSPPLPVGRGAAVKGAQSDRLCAVDPDRMKVLWDRPIAKSARLLGVDDRAVFLGGPELSALDLQTRTLLWATPPAGRQRGGRASWSGPTASGSSRPRGIFEIDPESGQVRRIFRGDDPGAVGRRPVPDRPLAPGGHQPDHLGLPARGGRGRAAPPATAPAAIQDEGIG